MDTDIERADAPHRRPISHDQYAAVDVNSNEEEQALLPSVSSPRKASLLMSGQAEKSGFEDDLEVPASRSRCCQTNAVNRPWKLAISMLGSFTGGVIACLAIQSLGSAFYWSPNTSSFSPSSSLFSADNLKSGKQFHFPPSRPTNGGPEYATYFPTNVGHAGPTPTGNEAGLIKTAPAYPVHSGAPNLVGPVSIKDPKGKGKKEFDIFRSWGNLSPWHSIPSADFGLPHASADPPAECKIDGLHFLHRHGARYPTSSKEGPEKFRDRVEDLKKQGKKWKASGSLSFLNDWEYALGNELLTPFGRQQMFDLGIKLRINYGYLLDTFNDSLPVFRTESQDRMLHSAQNFAVGFFGYPIEGQYYQSITYETLGVNNTLAPYMTCPNAGDPTKGDRGAIYVGEWIEVYLKDAAKRIQKHIDGIDIHPDDAYNFQQLCAYETVALGYSKFCELFTEDEWRGFSYALDLLFWYGHAFGSPLARTLGVGYIQELVSRLTHTPIAVHKSSTNATLDDNPTTFPLNQALYVDATHEVVVLNIITALNLTNFASDGPLPSDHIPKDRKFRSSHLAPFGTNIQFQLLSCTGHDTSPQIRIIINDGVTPLTGIEGCPKNEHGMCPVSTFVKAQQKIIDGTDWDWGCNGDWEVLPGQSWNTTTGDYPSRDEVGKDAKGGKRASDV